MNSRTHKITCIQEITTAFSLTWLNLANLVGILLAVLLLYPELNTWMSPFSYGRWVPLHMDWQLYGWCSLPLLGVLYRHFLAGIRDSGTWTTIGLLLWSLGLLIGGMLWLSGRSTGKLFLNWDGIAGICFGIALLGNWAILAMAWLMGLQGGEALKSRGMENLFKAMILFGLLLVPAILLYTSDPAVYPPVNPDSGGATGHSLLASSLSMVLLMGLFPGILLHLEKVKSGRGIKIEKTFWAVFILSCTGYMIMHHGDASNREWNQMLGLGSLLVWPVLVWAYWSRFQWDRNSLLWRWAFFIWWGMLSLDGWLIFLPGSLDILKFTNALVGHSHLAMAGMVSALNMVVLSEGGSSTRVRYGLSSKTAFWLWNSGCLLYVIVMTLQGYHEGVDPGALFTFDAYTKISYILRLIAGSAMVNASLMWALRMFSGKRISGVAVFREQQYG